MEKRAWWLSSSGISTCSHPQEQRKFVFKDAENWSSVCIKFAVIGFKTISHVLYYSRFAADIFRAVCNCLNSDGVFLFQWELGVFYDAPGWTDSILLVFHYTTFNAKRLVSTHVKDVIRPLRVFFEQLDVKRLQILYFNFLERILYDFEENIVLFARYRNQSIWTRELLKRKTFQQKNFEKELLCRFWRRQLLR